MNPTRDIIRHGAVAIRGNEIVAVGKASDLEAAYDAAETVGGDRFVVTPGLINTHIHITGEPLTRGYVPDDTPFEENVFMWLCPLYSVYTREPRSASRPSSPRSRCSSREPPSFLEAGTIRFTDEVMDGLVEVRHPGAASASGCGTCPPSPTCTARDTDNRHSQHQRHHRHATGALPAAGWRPGRWWWATPPAPIRCGGPPGRPPTTTAWASTST